MADKTSEFVDAVVEGTRIKGHAIQAPQGEDYFDVPVFSHIRDGLYMGGTPAYNPDVLWTPERKPRFDAILSLYPWESYPTPKKTEMRREELYDSGSVPAMEQLRDLRDWVWSRLEDGGDVLVHCQAGLNRSGLISALVLIKQGLTSAEAISLLRAKRTPLVLCNAAFYRYLIEEAETHGL